MFVVIVSVVVGIIVVVEVVDFEVVVRVVVLVIVEPRYCFSFPVSIDVLGVWMEVTHAYVGRVRRRRTE